MRFSRSTRDPEPARLALARRIVTELLHDGGYIGSDPDLLDRLRDPAADVTFAEAGIDSLALLTLTIDLEERFGVMMSADELAEAGGLVGLSRLFAAHL